MSDINKRADQRRHRNNKNKAKRTRGRKNTIEIHNDLKSPKQSPRHFNSCKIHFINNESKNTWGEKTPRTKQKKVTTHETTFFEKYHLEFRPSLMKNSHGLNNLKNCTFNTHLK